MKKTDQASSNTTTTSNNHEAQWERQGEWLVKLREHKRKLVDERGLQGWELWEAMASLSLDHKISTLQCRGNRCDHYCWRPRVPRVQPSPLSRLGLLPSRFWQWYEGVQNQDIQTKVFRLYEPHLVLYPLPPKAFW